MSNAKPTAKNNAKAKNKPTKAKGNTAIPPSHDVLDFMRQTEVGLQLEYARIQKSAASDPGTAGDQGEENWAQLLRSWLPPAFHVVTKGRILGHSGALSPQVDVLVLIPGYPSFLLDKKHYLVGGVVAAFECKVTLKASHVFEAMENANSTSQIAQAGSGTPYSELHSPILYGLLAHRHSWKGKTSQPVENIDSSIIQADAAHVKHPRGCVELICVANLGLWTYMRSIGTPGLDPRPMELTPIGCVATPYIGFTANDDQEAEFSPVGRLLLMLYKKLAWRFPEMRPMESYFLQTPLGGGTGRGVMRPWAPETLSEESRRRIAAGGASPQYFDHWCFHQD